MDNTPDTFQNADALDLEGLAQRFRSHEVKAIALMGSYARGDAGLFSDIDLVRFLDEEPKEPLKASTHIIEGQLVVVSTIPPSDVDKAFAQPEVATMFMAGLRTALPLWDPDAYFAQIQQRAHEFVWDEAMQKKANAYASREMVGWAEEVHKGLEGLRTGHVGRLLNARLGLSWGLPSVMRVQRGVLTSGDNGSYTEVMASMGEDTEWTRLCRASFGLDVQTSLEDQVKACLRLYVLTAHLLQDVLTPEDRQVIDHTVGQILAELERR